MSAPSKILIVDDHEPTRYAVRHMLQGHGYRVEQAATGAEALREAENDPDLIILDVRLPDVSGYDLRQQLKTGPRTADIPILRLSAGFADSEGPSGGPDNGADGYLTYPIEPHELIATIEAILRARQSEKLARKEGELWRFTLASIGEGVIATDVWERITFLNTVAEHLTGYAQPAALQQPIGHILRIVDERTREPIGMPDGQRFSQSLTSHGTGRALLISRNGAERLIDGRAAPIQNAEGNHIGTVIVFRDVTERRRAELALIDSNRHKDEFLAMLAHELRNPLAPIRNAVKVLNMISSQDPTAVNARAVIERQVELLARLVDDMLDMSRITRGLIKLHKERIELAVVISRAVESSRPLIDARGHQLEVYLPDHPVIVFGDVIRLAQVVLNLLNNAAKYTPEGGKITVSVEETDRHRALIKVRDNGMGIPPEMVPRIFDLFTQVERTLERADGGLGIGLMLVRRLTEMHGGTVHVSSGGPKLGSEFVVQLPLCPEGDKTPDRSSTRDWLPSLTLPSLRILVVDDNRDSADTLAMLLRLFGSDVRIAYHGQTALEMAAAFLPELVLLDVGLPGMDGLTVAKELRKMGSLQDAFIVALTGFGTEDDRRQTHQAGCNAHFVKPIDLHALQQLMRDLRR